MSAANDLIERMEAETGQRIDSSDGDNPAMAGLMGAMSRLMGKSPTSYRPEDDVAAGLLIRHEMSEAGERKRQGNDTLRAMLLMGFSPDDLTGE